MVLESWVAMGDCAFSGFGIELKDLVLGTVL